MFGKRVEGRLEEPRCTFGSGCLMLLYHPPRYHVAVRVFGAVLVFFINILPTILLTPLPLFLRINIVPAPMKRVHLQNRTRHAETRSTRYDMNLKVNGADQ
ncbi:hypothetical protein CALVIDRAFT_403754 [Calocera viscosa TUFC12733]|uniref:Uncharacterized protein n=1 Tax=Calocera viscosa (strain TUFC12733) TaxID=1330018 RepID=A0A167PUP8_CALVF|nr:hypothetical protein CALVIDRAFT_403754 [Calocera viscosa TUFC12733]